VLPIARKDAARLTEQLNSIPTLSRGELIAIWSDYYGAPSPKGLSTRLLTYAVAYRIQVELYGGLSKTTQKELLRLAAAAKAHRKAAQEGCAPVSTRNKTSLRPRSAPSEGTRFVREWNGRTHVVDVAGDGFIWQGKTYRSLSVIASTITGSRWSGPRFFGLT
jgi:hypothetical protein